jgi:hypothetical protein
MAIANRLRLSANRLLERVNLRLDTLTALRAERTRLEGLKVAKYFDQPAFPLPGCMSRADPTPMMAKVDRHRVRYRAFIAGSSNETGYSFENSYFSSPDAEVLYAMLLAEEPRRVIEIGCGNSTRVTRQAILDGRLDCRLICVDPKPRFDIQRLADEVSYARVEALPRSSVIGELRSGDVLFIDSSHASAPGNDVAMLFLRVLPTLRKGVLVHVHDVFLPFDYPHRWLGESHLRFDEQYLLHALLCGSDRFEVLWPGYYWQQTLAGFSSHFEHLGRRLALSFWFRVRRDPDERSTTPHDSDDGG